MMVGDVMVGVVVVGLVVGSAVFLCAWMRARSAREMARIETYSKRLLGDTKRTTDAMLEDARLKAEAFAVNARTQHERRASEYAR